MTMWAKFGKNVLQIASNKFKCNKKNAKKRRNRKCLYICVVYIVMHILSELHQIVI